MDWEVLYVLILLGLTVLLFVTELLRPDLVAVIALVALALAGILSVEQALAGFASEAVIAIASLLVIGEGLVQSGVVRHVADGLRRLAGASPTRLLLVSTASPGLLSGFINIVAAVSVFIPAVRRLAAFGQVSPSRLLLPMAATALLGANLSLIGASHNLVVNGIMMDAGLDGLGFFEISLVGVVLVTLAVLYSLLFARWLLPERAAAQPDASGASGAQASRLARTYQLHSRLWQVWIGPGSAAADRPLSELGLGPTFGLSPIALLGGDDEATAIRDQDVRLAREDVLLVEGRLERVQALCQRWRGLSVLGAPREVDPFAASESELAELTVPARSRLIGRPLASLRLPEKAGLTPIALWRDQRPWRTDVGEQRLRAGDGLLLFGPNRRFCDYAPEPDLVWSRPPPQQAPQHAPPSRAIAAAAIFALVILAAASGWVSVAIAALAGAGAMVLLKVLSAAQVYRAVDGRTLVLIAAMLPMGTALEATGAAQQIADLLTQTLGAAGPLAVMTALGALAMLLTQPLHNAAVAVVMTPTALTAAEAMGAEPRPFAIAVLVGASASFLLPTGHPAPLLVQEPGAYRGSDYPRFGLGLALMTLAVIALVVPLIWPLAGN